MEIIKTQNSAELIIALKGRLDTTTAPSLEAELTSSCEGVSDLVFDFANLEYISSAGLRILLSAKKMMDSKGGNMVVRNVNDDINEVFEITGFSSILTIE